MSTAPAAVGHRGVRGLGLGIGGICLSLGLALTLTPRRTAGSLGWGDKELLARVIGAADTVVGTGLLLSAHPSRWMPVRNLLNVVIGGAYAAGVLSTGTCDRRLVPYECPDHQRLPPDEVPAGDRSLV